MLFADTIRPETLGLLRQVMQVPELELFVLVGGTNLSLRYGHRLSVDLDLFTNQPFSRDEVLEGIRKVLPQTVLIDQRRQTLWLTINGVKVDVILHEYPYLRGVKKDFWDVAELLNHFTLGQMLDFYQRKYTNNDPGHILLSMTYFVDAEVEKINPQSLNGQTWFQIKATLTEAVKRYVKSQL